MSKAGEQTYPSMIGSSHVAHRNHEFMPVDRGAILKDSPVCDKGEFHNTEEWKLAWRIAGSKRLLKSELLQRFLLYICEQSLTGNPHQITEQKIGTLIFNRAPDYNPGEDNIVRSYARMLRKRLDEYFEEEGIREPMRIVVPRGGYLPIFQPVISSGELYVAGRSDIVSESAHAPSNAAPVEVALLPTTQQTLQGDEQNSWSLVPAQRSPMLSPRRFWLALSAGFLGGVLLTLGIWFANRVQRDERSQALAHPLWMQMFQHERDTLIVPADSGLGILQNLTGRLVSLDEYANGSYASGAYMAAGVDSANLKDLRQQRYTSVVDLNIASTLERLPESANGHSHVRYARSITTEDLKTSNVILLGSMHTNPWVSLFDRNLNFKLEYMPEVDQSFVLNERPEGKEQKQYFNGTGESNRTYGAIDYLPSLDGRGHVLIIQGLNMAATQAAAETLFNSPEIKRILEQAKLPNGGLKSFELLIETSSIGATDPNSQIIAMRFYS